MHVKPVMAAYRASEHSVTGLTHNFMMLGREVTTPIDIVLGEPKEKIKSWKSENDFV